MWGEVWVVTSVVEVCFIVSIVELSLCPCSKEVSSMFNFWVGFEGGAFLYLAFFFFFLNWMS